jgi:hypothetical protein
MKRFIAIALLFGLLGCEDANAPQPTERISADALLAHLGFLAGDSLYGRGAGSPHELIAAEYIRDAFVDAGLDPGIPGYLQTFSFVNGSFDVAAHTLAPQESGDRATATAVLADTLISQNVLAVLPGRGDLAGQWVILGAHYDHLGWHQVTEDSIVIYNGADDNASGTALMLEIARYLTDYLTFGAGETFDHRSIMFQAYGAEELGLIGSSYFTANPTVPMDSIVAMINLDMVGRLRDDKLIMGGALTSGRWNVLLVELNEDSLNLEYNDDGLARSDQYPFFQSRKPVLFFHTGLHSDYHRASDDTEFVYLDGMVEVGRLALSVLFNVAIGTEPPAFQGGSGPTARVLQGESRCAKWLCSPD